MEEVVFADGGIEEISLGDPGWIFVVVLCIRCRNAHESRGKSSSVTHGRQRLRWRRLDTIAGKAGLELLVGGQAGCGQVDAGRSVGECDGGAAIDGVAKAVGVNDVVAGYGAGREAAIVTPVEANPRAVA